MSLFQNSDAVADAASVSSDAGSIHHEATSTVADDTVDDLINTFFGKASPAHDSRAMAPKQHMLRSSLPMEIAEFRNIVESFVNGLGETLAKLRHAQTCMDYQEIRELAHRLKGTGGTVGFADFTEPSRKLQTAAENHEEEAIEAMITELEVIASRLEIAEPALA